MNSNSNSHSTVPTENKQFVLELLEWRKVNVYKGVQSEEFLYEHKLYSRIIIAAKLNNELVDVTFDELCRTKLHRVEKCGEDYLIADQDGLGIDICTSDCKIITNLLSKTEEAVQWCGRPTNTSQSLNESQNEITICRKMQDNHLNVASVFHRFQCLLPTNNSVVLWYYARLDRSLWRSVNAMDRQHRIEALPSIVPQIVAGLQHLHKHGIAHFALNLENIVINTDNNVVKISGFGRSKYFQNGVEKVVQKERMILHQDVPELMDDTVDSYYPDKVDVWLLGKLMRTLFVDHLTTDIDCWLRGMTKAHPMQRMPLNIVALIPPQKLIDAANIAQDESALTTIVVAETPVVSIAAIPPAVASAAVSSDAPANIKHIVTAALPQEYVADDDEIARSLLIPGICTKIELQNVIMDFFSESNMLANMYKELSVDIAQVRPKVHWGEYFRDVIVSIDKRIMRGLHLRLYVAVNADKLLLRLE